MKCQYMVNDYILAFRQEHEISGTNFRAAVNMKPKVLSDYDCQRKPMSLDVALRITHIMLEEGFPIDRALVVQFWLQDQLNHKGLPYEVTVQEIE